MSDLHDGHPVEPPLTHARPQGKEDFVSDQGMESYDPEEPESPAQPKVRWLAVAVLMILMVIGLFWVRNEFLIIRHVQVEGVRQRPWQEVAFAAGFDKTVNFFGINEERVSEGINGNRYFTYLGMEKRFPDTIILRVRERIPVAYLQYIGVAYLLADDGFVLEQTQVLDVTQGYTSVSGMQLRDIRVGALPTGYRPQQLTSALMVLRELAMQGFIQNILDINVSEPSTIYLTTRDGYTIHIGNQEELRAKIGTVRAVLDDLMRRGITSGLIEATVPGEATYRPETE